MRKDRPCTKGGGVCALVKKCFRIVPVTLATQYDDCEITCFDLLTRCERIRFALNYVQTLVKCLSAYTSDKFISIVCGDFNLPKIDWYTYTGHLCKYTSQF